MKMNKKGFTLIEMLVVIAIIAILVAIVIPTVSNATTKAKEATDVANIRSAIAEYEIKTLTDSTAKFTFDAATKLNYPANYKYDEKNSTVTYTPTVLQKEAYTWSVGNIYTDTETKAS